MIKKDPKLSKPVYKYSNNKNSSFSCRSIRSITLQGQARSVTKQAKSLVFNGDDVEELRACIESLMDTVEELDQELDSVEEYITELDTWGENWNEIAHNIDEYSVYPFICPVAHNYKYVVPMNQMHSHGLCGYAKAIDLYNETGLCFAGYDYSEGIVFDVIDEKRWLLSKLKNGY